MKRHVKYGLLSLLLLIAVLGCDDFLDVQPIDAVTNQNLWKTEKDAQNTTNALIRNFRSTKGNVVNLYRDRALPFDVLGMTWEKISNNDLSNYTATDTRFSWWSEYQVIANANDIIDNLYRIGLSQDRFNNYMGQARFIRALTYFYLVRDFGDIPLFTNSVDKTAHSRISWPEGMAFVISEARECAQQLPPFSQLRDDEGKIITSKGIPCRGAAYALLAHAYAWLAGVNNQPELWIEVVHACDSVINSGEYSLLGSPQEFNDIGLAGNSCEGIYESDFQYEGNYKSSGSFIAAACEKWPVIPMTTVTTKRTPRMLNATYNILYPDPNDLRRSANAEDPDYWAQQNKTTTQDAVYIKKWGKSLVLTWTEGVQQGRIRYFKANDILFRLADIHLLRAEALAHVNDIDGAIRDINVIRDRAQMYKYTIAEGPILEAIFAERERELFLEGHRFYDIVRFHYHKEKLRGKFKTATEEDIKNGIFYLPVSSDMAKFNTLGEQTAYYKNEFPF